MNTTAKAIIERHQDDLDKNGIGKANFENIVRDAIKANVLDDVLDIFYVADITIPPEVVTKQLYDFYSVRVVKTDEERARYMRKINYFINKHQNVFVKTLDAPKNNLINDPPTCDRRWEGFILTNQFQTSTNGIPCSFANVCA